MPSLGSPRTTQRFILVVEDDLYVVQIFHQAFAGQSDMLLDVATSLPQALSKIRTVTYDVIFLDMKLGHSDAGMEVLRELDKQAVRLRSDRQPVSDSLVVIMTASINLKDVMHEANELGVLCFIDKPVPMTAEFVRRIARKLGMPLMPKRSAVSGS